MSRFAAGASGPMSAPRQDAGAGRKTHSAHAAAFHNITDTTTLGQMPFGVDAERGVMHLAVEAADDDVFGARQLVSQTTVQDHAPHRPSLEAGLICQPDKRRSCAIARMASGAFGWMVQRPGDCSVARP